MAGTPLVAASYCASKCVERGRVRELLILRLKAQMREVKIREGTSLRIGMYMYACRYLPT